MLSKDFLSSGSPIQGEAAMVPMKSGSSTLGLSAPFTNISANKESLPVVNIINSGGFSVDCQFKRQLSSYGVTENVVSLILTNNSNAAIEGIQLQPVVAEKGRAINGFDEVETLNAGSSKTIELSFEFALLTASFSFTISTKNKGAYSASITPPIGELVTPMPMNINAFKQELEKLRAFNQESSTVNSSLDTKTIAERIVKLVNANIVAGNEKEVCLAAKTKAATPTPVLIQVVKTQEGTATVNVASEKNLFAVSLCQQLSNTITA